MSDILAFYQQQVQAKLSQQPWLALQQNQALKTLAHLGFPTRKHEEWKYTSVDALLKQAFLSEEGGLVSKPPLSDLPLVDQVSLSNGVIVEQSKVLAGLPQGVLLLPLSTALIKHAELIKPFLNHILQSEHGFHALNTAFIGCGMVLYIPKDVHIETPIVLSHYQDKEQHAVYLRHLIIAEQGSQATIIEDYRGDECTYVTNTITEVFVGTQAHITHYKIQRESKKAFHLGHLAVKQSAESHFASHSMNLGAALARSDISILLQAEKAHCVMNGIYVPTEGQHVDHHTTVHHLVPHCTSEQDYKGILKGRAKAVFNGKVIVAKDAQKTQAKQQNKNLLLSNHAEINTKPQLEIFADDVICSHGATVGQLDEDAVFYLASRGIDRLEASQYLIHAFAQDNLRLIPHRELASWMGQLLIQHLG